MGNDAAEKTEEATSRRRTKERERGNVSKSRDMDSALVMVAGVALLGIFAKGMIEKIQTMMRECFSNLSATPINMDNIMGIFFPYFKYLAIITLPFMVLLVIFSIIVICIWNCDHFRQKKQCLMGKHYILNKHTGKK